jgi:hypothetical protein
MLRNAHRPADADNKIEQPIGRIHSQGETMADVARTASRTRRRHEPAQDAGRNAGRAPERRREGAASPLANLADVHRLHREGIADDEADWNAHPRLERKLRSLYLELARTTAEIERIKTTLPTAAADDGPTPFGIASDRQRMADLEAQRKRQWDEVAAVMTVLDPTVTGILDQVKSAETRDAENTFNTVWKDYQRTQKASWSKYGWTLLSGTIAYSIPFGIATMASRGAGLPWLVPIIAGPLHTLFEPFWTSIRSVTWTNPNVDALIARQRAHGRAIGDRLRACAGVKLKKKFIILDPDGGPPQVLSAKQFMERGSSLQHWAGKVHTDDTPFFIFTVLYSGKNSAVEWMGMDFYAHSHKEWVGTTYYGPQRYDGTSIDLGLQFLAGMLSGGFTMLLSQGMRRLLAERTGGREVVTKSLHVWRLETRFLRLYIKDIDGRLQANVTATPRSKYVHKDRFVLEQKKKELEVQLMTAEAKSGILSGLVYDLGVMWQGKRRAVGTGPDISGKRIDTICSILGRSTSLLQGVGMTYLAQPFQGLASCCIDPVSRVLRHIGPPLALVAWPGFAARLELQGMYRMIYGTMKGVYSAIGACCCGLEQDEGEDANDDEDEDEATPPRHPALVFQDQVTRVPQTDAGRAAHSYQNVDGADDADADADDDHPPYLIDKGSRDSGEE